MSCQCKGSKYAEMPAGVVSKDDSIGSPRAFSACAAAVPTSMPHFPCVHLSLSYQSVMRFSSAQAPELSFLGHLWAGFDAFGLHGCSCCQIMTHCLNVLCWLLHAKPHNVLESGNL